MTLASTVRLLALLLVPCLVLPAWGGPAAVQGGQQAAPDTPAAPSGEQSTPNTPAPTQNANNGQACSQCAKAGQGCSSCGSRLASLFHRQTCVHVHQKKICAPCGLKNYGYYPHCWHPWPFPTYYGHCPPPVPAAAFQPPWYEPGNPHPPKGDEALPAPTPAPDLKEEPNGDKKKDEDTKKKDEDTKKKDDETKKKDSPDKLNPGNLQGRLLPPLSNYNVSGK
jgi:hypothetical protein